MYAETSIGGSVVMIGEWFDPTTRPLVAPTPRIAWSAWRADTAGLALDSRASPAG